MNMKRYLVIIAAVLMLSSLVSADCVQLTAEQLSFDTDSSNVKVSGNNAVWVGKDPNGYKQIYFYNGNSVTQLTSGNTDNDKPHINSKKIVWQGQDPNGGDWEIFFYNNGCIQQITNNDVNDTNPKLSGTRIFWEKHEGSDSEIMTAAIPKEVLMIVTPKTINLKNKGQFINVKVFFGNIQADDVNFASIKLLGSVSAQKIVVSSFLNNMTIKFDRSQVQALLTTGNSVEIVLTGKLNDGTVFTASDTVKVISPGKAQSNTSNGSGGVIGQSVGSGGGDGGYIDTIPDMNDILLPSNP